MSNYVIEKFRSITEVNGKILIKGFEFKADQTHVLPIDINAAIKSIIGHIAARAVMKQVDMDKN